MNDRISTPIRKVASYLNYFTLTFIFLLSFQPFLKLSAQEEDDSPADTAAIHALVRKTQNSNIPRTWEPLIPLVNNSQCANSDFSYGTFLNWKGCYGTWCNNVNQNQTRCTTGLYVPFNDPCTNLASTWSDIPNGGHFSIQSPGTDPCIASLQRVFPGDTYSALIGNRTCVSGGGGYCDKLSYQIVYDPNNSFFIYRCAVVLENPNDPSHNTPDRKPRFLFEIRDQATGALVDPVCGVYDLTPGDGITVWQNGPGDYLYKDWNTIGIDFNALTGLVPGQVLNIVFTVHGCAMTAHTAYAYISCFCGSMSIANTGCNGSGSVTMTGPPGFTAYEWQGPYCPTCSPTPPTYTGNPITITAAEGAITGNTFHLTLTALNGCQVQNVQQIIAFTTIHAGFKDSLGCAQRSSFFFDTSTVSQNAVTAWLWDFGDPASAGLNTSTLQNPVHAFTAAGTYNVKLKSYSTEGCPDSITMTVVIGDLVVITSPNHRSEICSGQHAVIPLTANFGDALYTWTATTTGTITGFTNNAIPALSPIDQILVNPGPVVDSVTYIITPHESSCTGDPFTFRVVVYPTPTATIAPATIEVCQNAASPLITFTGATGTPPYTFFYKLNGGAILNITTVAGNSVTLAAPTGVVGVYNYSLASVQDASPNTCSQPQGGSAVVTVNSLPVPTITGAAAVCLNSSSVYATEPGMTGYNWIVSSGGTITAGSGTKTITVNWTTTGAKTITVNYNDAKGCTAATPTSYNVTVNPLPTPALNGTLVICNGFSATYTSDAGMNNYLWTVSAGGTITSGGGLADNTVTIHWTVAGSQTVTVNYTLGTGCTAPTATSRTVIVNALPIVTIAGTPVLCAGSTGIVYSTQVGMSNYQWAVSAGGTVTAGGTPTDNTITITWNTAGPRTVSVNYQDANGCTATTPTVYPVTVNALPVPTLAGTAFVCAGTTGVIYTTQPGMNNYTWAISAGGIITSGGTGISNTATVTWNTAGAQNVSVNYHDPNGCIALTPVVYPVTVNPLPVPAIAGNNNLCAGTTGVIYSTQVGMTNYSWIVSAGGTITAGGTAADNTITVTWNTAGAQNVSVNFNDANTCRATSPTVFPVTVHALPVPAIAGSNVVCAGTTGVIYTTQGGNTNYQWVISGGGTITSGGTAVDNTITVTWNIAGAQTVSVNFVDLNGCTATASTNFNVTVNPLPVPTIGGLTSVCLNSSSTYTTEAGMTGYLWAVTPGGTISAGAGTNTVTITWNSVGPKTVSVNYLNGFTCTAPSATTYLVTVNPLPAPTLLGTTSICTGFSATYTTEAGMTNYTWLVSLGGTVTAGGGVGNNTVTILWTTVGVQSVRVNYFLATGCTAGIPTLLNVTVNPLPVVTIAGNPVLCAGSTGVVYTTQAGMTNYQWTVSPGGNITSGGNATDNSVTVTWNIPGPQSVSVNYINGNGCTALAPSVFPVTVNPLPVPVISGAASVCLNSTATYTTAAGMTNYSWIVSPGGSITSGSGTSSITILWTTTGPKTITLNFNDANGCAAPVATSYPVTVNLLPTPALNGNLVICNGFSATYSTDAGMNNYIWTVTAGGTITSGGGLNDNTATIHWTVAGSQTVTVNYTLGTGCTAPTPTVRTVIVNPLPIVTISGTPVLCAGSTGIVYATQVGMSNYQWTVSGGGTVTSGGTNSDNTITVTWNAAGAQSVTVNYNDANGCTALSSTTYPILVNPLPVPGIAGPASVCQFSSSTYFTEVGKSNYTWSVSAGGSITSGTGTATITILWNITGAKTITVNYNDANGCTAPAPTSYPVMVNVLPAPPLNGSNTTCTNTTINYTTDPGMSNYIWTVSPGGSITGGGGTGDSFADVLWNTAGPQTISVNYNMATGCSAQMPTVLNVAIKPRPAITNASGMTICSNGTTNFTFASTIIGTTYTWTASGSTGNVSGYLNGAGPGIFQTLVNAGFNIEVVTYTVTPNLNGCDGPVAIFTVNVNPVADVYFTPNGQSFCTGGTSNITIASHVLGTTFTWTATGSSFNVSGYSPGNGSLIAQTLVNSGPWFENVDYHVFPVANSCAGTDNHVIVNLNPTPQVSFDMNCNDIITTTDAKPFTLKGGVPLGGTYTGPGVNAGIFNPSLAGPGLKTINYSYANTWGCSANLSQNISVVNGIPFNCDNILIDMRDNKNYPTVKIGTQCWMASNLDVGTPITSSAMQRDNCVLEKYCYGDNAVNCTSMGGLYQWYEMMRFEDTPALQGICPPAWHVPTENDWATLFNFYISNGFAGSPLKWDGYSGFNAFRYGTRFDNANFFFTGFSTFIWSSSSDGPNKAWSHAMNTFNPSVSNYPGNRSNAFSVRCIKD